MNRPSHSEAKHLVAYPMNLVSKMSVQIDIMKVPKLIRFEFARVSQFLHLCLVFLEFLLQVH